MNRTPLLILHKSEWDRLQRQSVPPVEEEPLHDKTEYIKALTELSQAWIKTWPDTVAGQFALIKKQKKNQRKANAEFIKTYKNSANISKHKQTAEAIKNARQLIFEDSNYGKKLVSALLESRAIDERDAQIKFNKEVKEKATELAKKEVLARGGIDMHEKDAERKKQEKLRTLDCIRVNQEIVLLKKEKQLQEKLIEKKYAIEDEKLMKQVIEIEEMEKEDVKRCTIKKRKKYEDDTNKFAEIKEQDEKLTNALIEIHKKEQDRIKLKTKAVLKKVHLGRTNTKSSRDLYEKVKQMQTEENKRYEDFIDKGVKAYEQRNSKKEAIDRLQEKQKGSSRYLTSQINKIIGVEAILAKKFENKRGCDRQSLIMNLSGKPKKETKVKTNDVSSKDSDEKICDSKGKKVAFLASRNKLTEELRKREKIPSPWTGARGEHAHFAEQADSILKEVHHKYFARKVVDDYRKLNCLDAKTLPVPNY